MQSAAYALARLKVYEVRFRSSWRRCVHTRGVSWAKAAIALGIALLAVGFGVGVEPTHASLDERQLVCASAIPVSWLAPGTRAEPASQSAPTPQERRADARCGSVVHRTRWLTWGVLGLGGLVAVAGWTALREREPVPAVRRPRP